MIKKIRIFLNVLITTFSIFICLIVSIYIASFFLGPPPLINEQNTVFLDASEEVVGEESGTENRTWVTLENISPYVKDAMIAIEDKNFYDHSGFDIKGIFR